MGVVLPGALAAAARGTNHASRGATQCAAAVRPTFSENGPFIIVQGRHPLVEHACGAAQRTFVPNDLFLGPGANMMLLTGPNCSGAVQRRTVAGVMHWYEC